MNMLTVTQDNQQYKINIQELNNDIMWEIYNFIPYNNLVTCNKYLNQLATLSSKSVNDLLKLCTTKQNNGTFDYELVIIAFNYGGEITKEEGKKLFEEYVKKYGEYKSETTSIRISPTLGSTSVVNPGPILGPPSSASSSSSLSVATLSPPSGPNPSSTPGPNPVTTIISTPVTVPDPTSGPLLKELLDSRNVYIL